MPTVNLRHTVRVLILDEDDRILLCRFVFPQPTGTITVGAAPGGGVEEGESLLGALRRELHEEVGLVLDSAPHVWHQEVVAPGHAEGYDGVVNGYFLVRTVSFSPRGAMTDDELAAENIRGLRWWRHQGIAGYGGPDLFSPRDLATPLASLVSGGVPRGPVRLGL